MNRDLTNLFFCLFVYYQKESKNSKRGHNPKGHDLWTLTVFPDKSVIPLCLCSQTTTSYTLGICFVIPAAPKIVHIETQTPTWVMGSFLQKKKNPRSLDQFNSGFYFLPAEVILTGICSMTECYLSRAEQISSIIS